MQEQAAVAEPVAERPAKRGPGRPTLSNEELLDTALDLFLEKGFERTSIEAICAAAGMAKRTVYARYGDKTTLFKAALKRAIEEWIVPVERLRSAEAVDMETSLLTIGNILAANLASPAGLRLLRLTNSESGRMPEIGAYNVQQGTQPTLAYLADFFARHATPAPDQAAKAFLDLVVGGPAIAAAWGDMAIDGEGLERHTRYSVSLFLHGLLATREAAGEPAMAAAAETRRLRELLGEVSAQLDAMRTRLAEARKLAE